MLPLGEITTIFDQYTCTYRTGEHTYTHTYTRRFPFDSRGEGLLFRRFRPPSFRRRSNGKNGKAQTGRERERERARRIKRTRIPNRVVETRLGVGRTRQRDSSYLRNLRESGLNIVTRPNRLLRPCHLSAKLANLSSRARVSLSLLAYEPAAFQ